MPLYLAQCDTELKIARITGSDAVKKRLETMGFVVGETLKLVSIVGDNVIVKIKGVSLGLSYELAKRIHV